MSPARHAGGCLCGAVRFEFTGDPLWACYCHCRSCRRHTGAPVVMFVGVPARAFEVRGETARFASSAGVSRTGCPNCGTPLTYAATHFPGEVHIYCSVLDEADRYAPQFHVHYGEKVDWLEIDDRLPRYLTTSTGPRFDPEQT